LFAAFTIGLGVPRIHFGGVGPMFAALARVKPAHLTMPGSTVNQGHAWFISTVVLAALGFYMWPHAFASAFGAKSAGTLRRNAVFMPFYQLTMALMLSAGFAAVLVTPGLRDGDLSMLTVVRQTFSPWFLGVVGGAGALTAMVPASIILLAAATSLAKNVYRPIFAPSMTDDAVARLARITVVALSLVGLYFALYSSSTLVSLVLLGYAGATQFFPGVVLGLFWKRVSAVGVFTGIVVGVGVTILLVLSGRDPFFGLNAGFVALCLNFLITALLSLVSKPQSL